MVALYPEMNEDEQIFTEMIFLVDRCNIFEVPDVERSGSMRKSVTTGSFFGAKDSRINQVKETLQIFLRSLPG